MDSPHFSDWQIGFLVGCVVATAWALFVIWSQNL